MSQATFQTTTAPQPHTRLSAGAARRLKSCVGTLTTADRLRMLDARGLRIRSVQSASSETIVVNFDRLDGQRGFQLRVTDTEEHRYAVFLQWTRRATRNDRWNRPGRRQALFDNPYVTHRLVADVTDVTEVPGRANMYEATVSINQDWLCKPVEEQDAWVPPERNRAMVP